MPKMADARKRAGDYATGLSPSLEEIRNKEVMLRSYETSERPMRGGLKTFVEVEVADIATGEAMGTFHAWSDSLAEKLGQIPEGEFPIEAMFVKEKTSSNFYVWSVK